MSTRFISSENVTNYAHLLNASLIKDIGSERWWSSQDAQQKLSQQALLEVENKSSEQVKQAILENNKVSVLVQEAICMAVWRENLFPQLVKKIKDESVNKFLMYMVMYHETTAVVLLETILYHPEACKELGDRSIDLIDYCADSLTSLLSRSSAPQENDVKIDEAAKLLWQQEQTLTFGVGMHCIAILQYLVEHLECLPLCATTRLYKTHDFPMLMVHLIEQAPWCKTVDGKDTKYSDGAWREVPGGPICAPEAHAWLAVHQLLLYPELGKYYQMTEFARSKLMKLNGLMNDWLLSQLPPLHQLQQGLSRLATFQLPSQRQPLVLEVIPMIRNALLSEGTNGWDGIIQIQTKLLIDCSSSHASALAERMCETLRSASSTNTCMNCHRSAPSRCSRCKKAWYCSRQCQVSHYSAHKTTCLSEHKK